MTNTRCTLDPIRPQNGESGDDVQSEGAESGQGQVEVIEKRTSRMSTKIAQRRMKM